MKNGYKKQANYKDSFEDLYLRHDYLKRTNPNIKVDMNKYEHICKATAKIMYEKNYMKYNKVSFYFEDVLNITRVYSYSFLNTYSFENNPSELAKLHAEFLKKQERLPTLEEIQRRERNNLINFLRQRLSACSIFCERKSKNIIASASETVYFALTSNSVPASNDLILEDPGLFGYRKIYEKELEDIKNKCKGDEFVDENGFKIIEVISHSKIPISLHVEFDDPSSPNNIIERISSITEISAEGKFLEMEEEVELNAFKSRFNELNEIQKKNRLNRFIKDNSKNPKLKEEIKIARKFLKEIANVV